VAYLGWFLRFTQTRKLRSTQHTVATFSAEPHAAPVSAYIARERCLMETAHSVF